MKISITERYWIDDNPIEHPFGKYTVAVVDELAGGVIAYFNNIKSAQQFINGCIKRNEM